MKIRIPSNFLGKPIAGSMDIVLAKSSTSGNNPPQPPQKPSRNNVPDIKDYIFVPSLSLYVGKERIFGGSNWEQAKTELHGRGERMPTLHEFVEFLNYLKSDTQNAEYSRIVDDIVTVRDPWRGEWIDSKFSKEGRKNKIRYHTFDGNAIKLVTEDLQSCLMKDKTPGINLDYWLKNATSQGLPPARGNTKSDDFYYWYPREDYVAWFDAGSDWAGLNCDRDPSGSDPQLGVRAIRRAGAQI